MSVDPWYSERLYPAWWVWPVAVLLPLPLAVAYGSAYGVGVGTAIAALTCAAVITGLVRTSTVVVVDATGVHAGRASLPRTACGTAEMLDREAMVRARREARAYLVVRTWASPIGVRLNVVDADDPHESWVLSSRRPDALAAAMNRLPGAGAAPAA